MPKYALGLSHIPMPNTPIYILLDDHLINTSFREMEKFIKELGDMELLTILRRKDLVPFRNRLEYGGDCIFLHTILVGEDGKPVEIMTDHHRVVIL